MRNVISGMQESRGVTGRIAGIILVAVLCVLLVAVSELRAQKPAQYVKDVGEKIIVEVNYGDLRASRIVEVFRVKDRTALEVLQTVARVETNPVGQYVIVTAIDGVEGKRGELAWYYSVDGKPAGESAYSNVINDVSRMSWAYKKDLCSLKVDGKSGLSEKKGGEEK